MRIALALLLVLVGAAGVLWWIDSHRLAAANERVLQSEAVSRQIELVAGNLNELESDARGFVLGGDARFARDARQAAGNADSGVARLVRLTADPRQQELGSQLGRAVAAKIAFNENLLRTRETQGLGPAAALVASGDGLERMDRARAILDQMRSEEQRLLRDRAAALDRIRHLGFILGIVLAAFFVMGVTTFALLSRADRVERRRI